MDAKMLSKCVSALRLHCGANGERTIELGILGNHVKVRAQGGKTLRGTRRSFLSPPSNGITTTPFENIPSHPAFSRPAFLPSSPLGDLNPVCRVLPDPPPPPSLPPVLGDHLGGEAS